MAWYVFKDLSQLRGSGACWNEGVGGGGPHLSLSHTPTQIFQNALCIVHWHKQTSLQSARGLVCLQSICDNATVGSCSGGPASWCFLGSSWVIWGQKMCALMSLMPPVMLLVIFLAPKCEGRRCPRQFLFWRAMACTLLYLSIGLFHPQNFLIYITGFFILMLVQERSLKPHIRYKVSRKLGW